MGGELNVLGKNVCLKYMCVCLCLSVCVCVCVCVMSACACVHLEVTGCEFCVVGKMIDR